jgi:hypothetical protein
MMTNGLRNLKNQGTNETTQHTDRRAQFYFLLGWGREKHTVVFVPNVFPNMFLLAPHFYPICFAQSSPLSHLYSWAKGKAPYRILLWEASKVSVFNFYFVLGQSKWLSLNPKKKNLRSTPYI